MFVENLERGFYRLVRHDVSYLISFLSFDNSIIYPRLRRLIFFFFFFHLKLQMHF